jgi:hypothetical protein
MASPPGYWARRRVASPVAYPQRCAFHPVVRGFAPGGYIQGDPIMPDRVVPYISILAVQEMAQEVLGWGPRATHDDGRVAQLQAQVDALSAERDDLRARLAAVAVLKRMPDGTFEQARPPGRPRKQVA